MGRRPHLRTNCERQGLCGNDLSGTPAREKRSVDRSARWGAIRVSEVLSHCPRNLKHESRHHVTGCCALRSRLHDAAAFGSPTRGPWEFFPISPFHTLSLHIPHETWMKDICLAGLLRGPGLRSPP